MINYDRKTNSITIAGSSCRWHVGEVYHAGGLRWVTDIKRKIEQDITLKGIIYIKWWRKPSVSHDLYQYQFCTYEDDSDEVVMDNLSQQQPQKEQSNTMSGPKDSVIISVLQDKQLGLFYTVGVQFRRTDKEYTYKVHKSITLQEGDKVIVHNEELPNGGFVVGYVVSVHETPNIQVNSQIDYKWIVQKIDSTLYEKLVSEEEALVKKLADARNEYAKRSVMDTLVTQMPWLSNLMIETKNEGEV